MDEGVGSYHLLAAGVKVVGIDVRDDKLDRKLRRNKDFIFLHRPSQECEEELKVIVQRFGPIGLVYQDSSHHYLESKEEWELVSPLCKPGAVWLCDDITPDFYHPDYDPPGKGMMQYFEEIPRPHKKLYRDVLHFGNVQGVVIV